MKIKLRLNDGEVTEYPSIKEAKKLLNEADYYADRVEIVYSWEDSVVYTKKTCLSDLYREACKSSYTLTSTTKVPTNRILPSNNSTRYYFIINYENFNKNIS